MCGGACLCWTHSRDCLAGRVYLADGRALTTEDVRKEICVRVSNGGLVFGGPHTLTRVRVCTSASVCEAASVLMVMVLV